MQPNKDFNELVGLFNDNEVEFVIVGAYALAFHGAPRFTGDLDIYVHPTTKNAARVLRALDEFGFGEIGLQLSDFSTEDKVTQLGLPPVRIDIMTSITGVSWNEAWSNKVSGHYGSQPVFFLGKDEFIRNKKSIGRPQDLADIAAIDCSSTDPEDI